MRARLSNKNSEEPDLHCHKKDSSRTGDGNERIISTYLDTKRRTLLSHAQHSEQIHDVRREWR